MNQNSPHHSNAWVTFTYGSFGASAFLVAIGVYFLPVDLWIKGYLAMGIVMLIQSCVTLTKTVRDGCFGIRRFPVRLGIFDLTNTSFTLLPP
jgi:hypothetical protein